MPCTVTKARHLLEGGKAKVVKLNPLVIKLEFECENQTQEISLGIDSGYKTIGFSAIAETREISSGEMNLDNGTSKRLIERRMYRKNRRYRLRYRKPRFSNKRKSSGWLPPSIQKKFDTHINLINKIKATVPVKNLTVEIGEFDIQKVMNPDISGKDYQQGNLFGYNNMRSFLMAREKGKCQFCGKKSTKEDPFHIHHIELRSKGGTDRPDDLALLHRSCHDKIHKENLFNKLKKAKEYKAETFMSIIGSKFKKVLGCYITYGYETKTKRNLLGLEKNHINDAFVIAGGADQERCKPYKMEQKRINNRTLQTNRKGFIPSIRKQRHFIQNRDFVWIEGKKYLCGGTACRGTQVYYFDGSEKKLISSKKIGKVYHTGSLFWLN
jgi:5-methylcytosine-specific restriction endonuclease McrA